MERYDSPDARVLSPLSHLRSLRPFILMPLPAHIFVYGSLRLGQSNPMGSLLRARATFVDHAVLQGRLYLVADYPGAVDSPQVSDSILGEVYEFSPESDLLDQLDSYEGFDPTDHRSALFLRRTRQVTLSRGTSLMSWVYLYNRSTVGLQRIQSGDFLAQDPTEDQDPHPNEAS